jgi:hypothetical protein
MEQFFSALDFWRGREIGTKKKTISFVMSVSSSAWNNSAPTKRTFIKLDIWAFLRKSVEKIQVSLKSDKNNGHFT